MIVTSDEVSYIEGLQRMPGFKYFAYRPHLLLPLGFDEYVCLKGRDSFQNTWIEAVGADDAPHSIYRRPTGQWLWAFAGGGTDLVFHSKHTIREKAGYALSIDYEKLIKRLREIADIAIPDEKTVWTPKLWTFDEQRREKAALVTSARSLIAQLRQEDIVLTDITWRQLEDLVAELLRANGLEIHRVTESPQGGRDIIARGELIPGQEPLTMAVEVKHRSVVDRPEVQKALWQNRMFPALLFVTSGRFTAGVVEEKALRENQLRLFLKDGAALGDLIRDYRLFSPSPAPTDG